MSQIFEELERRGLIAQMTHPEKIREKLDNEKVVFYIGFDATADSLHVGHFLQLMVINHMIRAGHTPILLLGTGTTMVGDPTGRTDMRKMLTPEEINANADCFLRQMAPRLSPVAAQGIPPAAPMLPVQSAMPRPVLYRPRLRPARCMRQAGRRVPHQPGQKRLCRCSKAPSLQTTGPKGS